QALFRQILVIILPAQLILDEIDEGRIARRGGLFLVAHAEIGSACLLPGRIADQAPVMKYVEYQVATFAGAFRMAARTVITRPLDQCHQQGNATRAQFAQRLAEIEITGQAEAVYGATAFLAE